MYLHAGMSISGRIESEAHFTFWGHAISAFAILINQERMKVALNLQDLATIKYVKPTNNIFKNAKLTNKILIPAHEAI